MAFLYTYSHTHFNLSIFRQLLSTNNTFLLTIFYTEMPLQIIVAFLLLMCKIYSAANTGFLIKYLLIRKYPPKKIPLKIKVAYRLPL